MACWLSGSKFRISSAYVDGIAYVIRDAGPQPCGCFDRKQRRIIQRFSAAILLLLHEPECMRATPHHRRLDFAGTLVANW